MLLAGCGGGEGDSGGASGGTSGGASSGSGSDDGKLVATPGSSPAFEFQEVAGNLGAPSPASVQIQIGGANVSWHFAVHDSWLTVSKISGRGPATVSIGIARPGQPAGSYVGHFELVNDAAAQSIPFGVVYRVTAAQLVVDTSPIVFDVNALTTDTGITTTRLISDELSGLSTAGDLGWHMISSADWLHASAYDGRTSPPQKVQIFLSKTDLETLPPGDQTATLSIFSTDRANSGKQYNIPVTLNFAMPLVRSVIPTVIEAEKATTVRIRAEGLYSKTYPALRAGAQIPTSIHSSRTDGLEALLDLAPLSAGAHQVYFPNALGLKRTNAILVSQTFATPAAASIPFASTKSRLLYDRSRATLYAVVPDGIASFAWNGATWTTLAPISVPGLVDAALQRSGRSIVAVGVNTVWRVPLDVANPPLEVLYSFGYRPCGETFYRVGVTDDEIAAISLTNTGCTPKRYSPAGIDLIRGAGLNWGLLPTAGNAEIAVSSAGTRWYMTDSFAGASPLQKYESFGPYEESVVFPTLPQPFATVDTDASGNRVLLDSRLLVDATLNYAPRTQSLPSPFGRIARLSSDARRVYAYRNSVGGRSVDVYDVSWSAMSVTYVTTLTISTDLGDAAGGGPYAVPNELAMTLSTEDQLLFVAGPKAIAVLKTP